MQVDRPLDILVAGAGGLVGQGVVKACLASPDVGRVTALVRRPGSAGAPVPERVLVDFTQADARAGLAGFDACFYCAGALPVGTPEAIYREATLQATLAVARAFGQANPEGRFVYVSGAGANPHSAIAALRIKGETEQALAALPGITLVLRPGGVWPVPGTGTRHARLKPLYRLGGPLMKCAVRWLPSLATSNEAIGRAMIALVRHADPPGVVECAQINRWGG